MHAENGDEDKLLAAQLAHGVAEKLCNVDTLAIQTMLEDPILIKFIETLGRCYFSRLSEIWWMTPGFISSECSTTRLTKCMLRHANNEQELPLICPRQLRSMHLVPFTNKFSWQCFRLDKESGIVVFDNLERLVLDSRHYGIDVPDGAPRLLENEKKLETVFPELRQLLLRRITVTPEIVKPFVASPLKTVIFEGPLGSALQLRALKLGQLDALKVSTWFGFSVPDDEFYSDSNMLFQTTESAPVVKFCIDIEDKVISAADIYWPCLTHLDVCDKYIDDLALDLVPRVPNLVYLHVRAFRAGHCETDQCARRYFADLRLRYRQPSSSRITDVLLLFAADRPKIYDELAVGQFSRYLPNLRNIKID
ncbi:hypothetical protein IWW50_003560 [Coemansia erecta]|nr:hypothetical protein IWW50_003560 [Coemansia erecta]